MPHTPIPSGESRVRSTAQALHATTLSPHSLQHESDERLVALTRAGSERAFAEITRRDPTRSFTAGVMEKGREPHFSRPFSLCRLGPAGCVA